MAKRYICDECDTLYDKTHKCDNVCSLCNATPPCRKDQTKYCSTCNRYFLSEKCFKNHLNLKVKNKLGCQWRQVCLNCSYLVTGDSKHECNKRFCTNCNKKQPSSHFCYVAPLTASKLSKKYIYAFFIGSVRKTLPGITGLSDIFRISYVLSNCVLNVKPWTIWNSVNSVVSVSTCFGRIQ